MRVWPTLPVNGPWLNDERSIAAIPLGSPTQNSQPSARPGRHAWVLMDEDVKGLNDAAFAFGMNGVPGLIGPGHTTTAAAASRLLTATPKAIVGSTGPASRQRRYGQHLIYRAGRPARRGLGARAARNIKARCPASATDQQGPASFTKMPA